MTTRRRPFGYFVSLFLLCVVISFLGFVVWGASVAGAVTGGGGEVPEWPLMLWCGSWLLLGCVLLGVGVLQFVRFRSNGSRTPHL